MPLWPRPTDTVITDGDQNKQPTVAPPALAGTLLTLRFHHLYFKSQVCYFYSNCIVTKLTSQIRTRYFTDLQQNVLDLKLKVLLHRSGRRGATTGDCAGKN